jgi:hypothetical protein
MILPKIDAERFIKLVSEAPLIAFQRFEFGYAVAAQGEAYYAPVEHPGGGNLDSALFISRLALAAVQRMSAPALRTLRPTAKPLVTVALTNYLGKLAAGEILSFEEAFKKASGDDQAVVDFQTQVVIQAIEEHGRPDLQATMGALKADMMSDALDLVIQHAESARELCEVGHEPQTKVRLHLMQSVQAMKTALEMLLKP